MRPGSDADDHVGGIPIAGASKIIRDITERKRTEQALLENEANYRTLANSGTALTWTASPDKKCDYFNQIWLKFTGRTLEQELGDGWAEGVHPDDLAHCFKIYTEAFDRRENFSMDYRLRRHDGEFRWLQDDGSPRHDSRGNFLGYIGHCLDITERKQAEAALRESELMLVEAQQTAHIGSWSWNVETDLVAWSKELYAIAGRDPKSPPPSYKEHPSLYEPESWERLSKAVGKATAEGAAYELELNMIRPDGQMVCALSRGKATKNETGCVVRLHGIVQDITARKRLEEQLRQSQKMEAMGILAGGIAHDFNNILSAVLGYSHLLQQDTADNAAAQANLAEIDKAASRAKDLVQQILTFSRRRETVRKPLPLGTHLQETVKFLRATLPSSLEIVTQVAADGPAILGDATQIHQVVVNLATNAQHAMEGQPGRLTVSLDSFRPDPEFSRAHAGMRENTPYARITVTDNGCGMDAQTLKQIYDPFFTTKGVGKGTGLGLSVVHGIVQSHDGILTVESKPGEGTAFYIYIPAVQADEMLIKKEQRSVPRGQGQKILVVDDETALAKLLQMVLQRLNYEPTMATRPQAALELVRAQPAQYDLVITDLNMPLMDGLDLAKQLRVIRPDLPILLATGNIADLNPATLAAVGICELMEKPVRVDALTRAVHDALTKAGNES